MQSAIHRSFEALAIIGVTSSVLLVGCDAAATPRETLPLDHVSIHPNVHLPQHDALNAVLPAFERYSYDESPDVAADAIVPPDISAQGMLAVLFPAQL